jgi:hypothetical protein
MLEAAGRHPRGSQHVKDRATGVLTETTLVQLTRGLFERRMRSGRLMLGLGIVEMGRM